VAKTSGLGDRIFVAGYNLSGDINAVDKISGGPAALDFTGIDKSAMERLGGLRDGGIDATSFFNPGSDQAHDRFSALPTTDQIVTYCRGTTLGNAAASCVSKQIGYDGKRGNDGSFTLSVSAQANGYGVEWGDQLTAGIRTDTTATDGASVDYGATIATTSFGLQMYVHLFAFTGTSVTITIESSTDDAVGDAFATVTGATTGALTAVGATRVATATNIDVERYLRVATTGTFSDAQFSVQVVRNLAAPVF
jgi:hypothetical protein